MHDYEINSLQSKIDRLEAKIERLSEDIHEMKREKHQEEMNRMKFWQYFIFFVLAPISGVLTLG